MTSKKNKVDLKRVNINLPSSLVQRVIDYGIENGLNTTSAYIVLLNQALDQKETIKLLPTLLALQNKFSKTLEQIEDLSDEELKELLKKNKED